MQQVKFTFGKNVLYIDKKQTFAGNAYFSKRRNPSKEYTDLCKQLNNILPENFYDQNNSGKRVWARLTEEDISKINNFSNEYVNH